MKMMAAMLGASPTVIGMHSSSADLEPGILYTRFGIPIVSEDTFTEFMLQGVPPLVYAAPGGLYVRLDKDFLREIRQERAISLGALAEAVGVSRKAIQMYESGMGAMVDIANKIEDFLDAPLVLPLDPFAYVSDVADHLKGLEKFQGQNKDIFEMLKEIGYSVVPTKKAPFDAIAKEEELLLLTGIGEDSKKTEMKARVVGNLSRVTEKKSVIIVQKRILIDDIHGTALVTRDELRRVDHSEDLMDLILKREKRRTA
jgi:putative transcriptional regulator